MQPRILVRFPLENWGVFLSGHDLYTPRTGEFLLNHNRSGLLLALKALDLPKGSAVGLMAYNCHTVMSAVENAGLHPVFIDVTINLRLDLVDLQKKKDGVSALVISHLFGLANDIDAVKKMCPDIPIVEDCAHAYGMGLCGTRGDFAVFSIGAGKFPSIGDGGILRVNNDLYFDEVKRLYDVIPKYNLKEECLLFFKLAVMHMLCLPFIYAYVTLPLLKNKGNAGSRKEKIKLSKISDGVSAIYNKILPQIEDQKQRQQRNAACLMDFLSKRKDVRLLEMDEKNSNCFMFPVYCDSPELLKQEFRHKGIETETHFRHCILWAKEYGYRDGECPTAERLVKHLLMIPTYKEIKI